MADSSNRNICLIISIEQIGSDEHINVLCVNRAEILDGETDSPDSFEPDTAFLALLDAATTITVSSEMTANDENLLYQMAINHFSKKIKTLTPNNNSDNNDYGRN